MILNGNRGAVFKLYDETCWSEVWNPASSTTASMNNKKLLMALQTTIIDKKACTTMRDTIPGSYSVPGQTENLLVALDTVCQAW